MVSNSLDSDQDPHHVIPDLGPYCLQRLSADKERSLLARKASIRFITRYGWVLWAFQDYFNRVGMLGN